MTRSCFKPTRKTAESVLSPRPARDCLGLPGAVLGRPETDLYLIPGFNTDSVFLPILPFSSPTVHN